MASFEALWQAVTHLQPVEGITPMDMLDIAEPVGSLIRRLVRRGGATPDDLALELELDRARACQVGDALIAKGYVSLQPPADGSPLRYRVRLVRSRGRSAAV